MSLLTIVLFLIVELILGKQASTDANLVFAGLFMVALVLDHHLYRLRNVLVKPWEIVAKYLNVEGNDEDED